MIFAPILVRALARKFPARASRPDEYQSLCPHYRWLEIASQVAAVLGIAGSITVLIALHVGNTPWLLGAAFGWAVLTPVLLIAVFTLPRGITHWREFWRFYELTYQTSLRFLAPIFVALCTLGIISTAVLFSRR